MASDNHSRIFTTLLPQTAFINSNLIIVYTHTYSTTTRVCTTEREIERDFYFLKVHLGDSNRQPQSSRENLE